MKFSLAILSIAASSVAAQTLPPPSRTVYKCEDGKKVHYSDTPCLGAKRVDVEPTRGLNKSSGRVQTGRDVQDEKLNELMTEAFRPLINETPAQRATRHKRFKLEPAAKAECWRLDTEIPRLERQEIGATPESLAKTQRELLSARKRFQSLRC
jgi:hypothetical protein